MRLAKAGLRSPASRITLALTAAALLISGCTGSGGSGSGSSSGPISIALVPGVDNAPLRVAVADGLFRKHGLDVTITSESSLGQAVQAVSHGQADIVGGDYADLLWDNAKSLAADPKSPAPLRLVADGYDAVPGLMEILTWPGSGITTPQDLEGKTVATPLRQIISASSNTPYSMETLAAQSVLQSDGVSPTSITWRPTPAQDLTSELSSHQVDAILVTEPDVFEAESQLGATEVVDACSGVTAGLPLSGYFSSVSFASTHSGLLTAFRSVLALAQQNSGSRGPVEAALHTTGGLSAQDAAMMTLGNYPTFLSVGEVQRDAELMYNAGMISTPLDLKSMVSG